MTGPPVGRGSPQGSFLFGLASAPRLQGGRRALQRRLSQWPGVPARALSRQPVRPAFDWGFLQRRLELMLARCRALSRRCVVLALTSIHVRPLAAAPRVLGRHLLSCVAAPCRAHARCPLLYSQAVL